jgi:PadR family transcriptional regulator PadR
MDRDDNLIGGWESQLRKGLLDFVVLALLSRQRTYGLQLLRSLEQCVGWVVSESTLYPLLQRLLIEELVEAEWIEGESAHPRKYYALTPLGRRRVRQMARSWQTAATAFQPLVKPLLGERTR